MILKQLYLKNIRSYTEATINFNKGKTLFEGDIGSGKSTILLAVEFALFGLGDTKAAALLKLGTREGCVSLTINVEGSNYIITRNLIQKRNRIEHGDCILETPEGKKSLTTSEIKQQILDILQFNESSSPNSSSVIYRYAIFTPQEEMKEIINARPETRLDILRRAFRIESYKTTVRNSLELTKQIKIEAKTLEKDIEEIPLLIEIITELSQRISSKQKEHDELARKQVSSDISINGLQKDKNKLGEQYEEFQTYQKEKVRLITIIEQAEGNITSNKQITIENQNKFNKLKSQIQELEVIENPSIKTQDQLENEYSELTKKLSDVKNEDALIEQEIKNYEHVLQHKDCPMCGTSINPEEFTERLEKKKLEKGSIANNIKEHLERIEHVKNIQRRKKNYDDAEIKLNENRKSLSEYNETVNHFQEEIERSQIQIKDVKSDLERINMNIEKLKHVSESIKLIDKKIEDAQNDLSNIREQMSKSKTEIIEWNKQKNEKEELLQKKKLSEFEVQKLEDYKIWLEDYFIPTIEMIEKHVMINIQNDFNSKFQNWFNLLINEPSKTGRIDEAFTPILEQDGYEQEFNYLSGGEKTSIALAYRLSLNNIVQLIIRIKPNLLILDEPTDGFSIDQLNKVKEILQELQSEQVIIVSHEKVLESFADQIFKVKKIEGQSVITIAE